MQISVRTLNLEVHDLNHNVDIILLYRPDMGGLVDNEGFDVGAMAERDSFASNFDTFASSGVCVCIFVCVCECV